MVVIMRRREGSWGGVKLLNATNRTGSDLVYDADRCIMLQVVHYAAGGALCLHKREFSPLLQQFEVQRNIETYVILIISAHMLHQITI
mgnify:CR=1 FL=1